MWAYVFDKKSKKRLILNSISSIRVFDSVSFELDPEDGRKFSYDYITPENEDSRCQVLAVAGYFLDYFLNFDLNSICHAANRRRRSNKNINHLHGSSIVVYRRLSSNI